MSGDDYRLMKNWLSRSFCCKSRTKGFQGKILVVTAGLGNDDASQMTREGAAGIFLKHNPPARLARSIRKVMEGQPWPKLAASAR